ncbi:heme lyase CcmF/NrfE family subunit [Planctobacterium marinum]|uniref:heme lyase CcmF/NrfE family subunit n=1 Tax=Planctobacterium marinum TaxID=1631968 RepID=UPI001E571888|nr:heme lyase CcmF/NrfE family subunit [Planctobacterium marinum]MCC2606170.1 heme lyase CcmF/NrfE family subunit [Planctobacterium marinum]
MIAELGQLSLILAMMASMCLGFYPIVGAIRGEPRLLIMAKPMAFAMFAFTLLAYMALTHAFVTDDFTIKYVANHSNSLLPVYYKYTAVWGGHEGSFLLWMLMLSGWTCAVAIFSRGVPLIMVARVLGVLGAIALGFYLFLILASNPFESLLPYFPVDGRDLNPLLQDIGMIIHPPMLYMGYVGFSVAFAFAIAALMAGRLDSTWARWARPWALAAWGFLTLGITLGSWWAYYELGWGGWWFWDPVENASFMPWLAGTALIHSLAVTEKRKVFKAWTVLLAISAFSLSLLGTFLVRSGIIVSVHSFASDPERGLFILGLLVLVIGCSLALFAMRSSMLKSNSRYQLVSREMMLIGNNVFLTAATIVVLLGTLLPLVHKELGLGSISVGEPFFNQMFTWLIVPFVVLLAMGPMSRWKRQAIGDLKSQLLWAVLLGLVMTALLLTSFERFSMLAVLGTFLVFVIVLTTIQEILLRTNQQINWRNLRKLSRSHWGMVLGHLGFAVTLLGITLTSNFSEEREVRLNIGDSVELQNYQFTFKQVRHIEGPNYSADGGVVTVIRNGEFVTELLAEKRFYPVQRNVMTEAGIDSNLLRDLFVALGDEFTDGSWGLRVYVKPFVLWIWLGAAIMALGALLSIMDKRYRLVCVSKATQAKNIENRQIAGTGADFG